MRRAGWNMGISGPVCAIVFGPDLAGVDTCISFDKETIAATIVVTEEAVEPATAEVSFAVLRCCTAASLEGWSLSCIFSDGSSASLRRGTRV